MLDVMDIQNNDNELMDIDEDCKTAECDDKQVTLSFPVTGSSTSFISSECRLKLLTVRCHLLLNSSNIDKDKIYASIMDKYDDALIVWSPLFQVTPDFVVSLLSKYESTVDVRHRWIVSDLSPALKIWGGAVAVFDSKSRALQAAQEIRMTTK